MLPVHLPGLDLRIYSPDEGRLTFPPRPRRTCANIICWTNSVGELHKQLRRRPARPAFHNLKASKPGDRLNVKSWDEFWSSKVVIGSVGEWWWLRSEAVDPAGIAGDLGKKTPRQLPDQSLPDIRAWKYPLIGKFYVLQKWWNNESVSRTESVELSRHLSDITISNFRPLLPFNRLF